MESANALNVKVLLLAIIALALYQNQAIGSDHQPEIDNTLTTLNLTDDERGWLEKHETIRIGIIDDRAPMSYVDESDFPRGASVEIINTINKQLGGRVELIPSSWKLNYRALQDGHIDALMDVNHVYTQKTGLLLTKPYTDIPHFIFTRVDWPTVENIYDLDETSIGVESDNYTAGALQSKYPNISVKQYSTTLDALQALSSGKVDAYIGNRAVAMHILANERIKNIKPQAKTNNISSVNAIAVRSDLPLLRSILQKGLDSISYRKLSSIIHSFQPDDAWSEEERFLQILSKEEREYLASTPSISIGTTETRPPLSFNNEIGETIGIDIDIIKAMNSRLGDRIKPHPAPFDENLEKLKIEKLDAIMDLTPKEKEYKHLRFTRPYMTIPYVLVGRKNGPYFSTINDIHNKTMALEEGHYNVQWFKQTYPHVNIKQYPNTSQALDAVSNGDADIYAGNSATTTYLMRKMSLTNLTVQGRASIPPLKLSIGIQTNKPLLASILDRALADLRQHELNDILRNWTGRTTNSNSLHLTKEELDWISEHPVIRVSNEADWPPYDYSSGDKPTGFSVDYMDLLANKIGVKFNYKTANWTELINEFKNKKIDVIHPIHYSQSRENFMLFTDPFLTLSNVAVVRQDETFITSIKQLYGKTLASANDWAITEYIETNHPKIKILHVNNALEGLKAVQFDNADAWIDAYGSSRYLIDTHQMSNLKIGGEIADTGRFRFVDHYIGVRNDWPIFHNILQKALASVTQDEKHKLNEKWRLFSEVVNRLNLTSEEQLWITNNPTVSIASTINMAPVSFQDEEGHYQGLINDYILQVESILGIEFNVITYGNREDALNAFQSGEVDLLTPAQKGSDNSNIFKHTSAYTSLPIAIFTGPKMHYVGDLDELNNHIVAVVDGQASHNILKQEHPSIQLRTYDTTEEALNVLNEETVDAFVGPILITSYYIGKNGYSNLNISGSTPYSYNQSFGLHSKDIALQSILNKVLNSIPKADREAIYHRWVGRETIKTFDYSVIWKTLTPIILLVIILFIWNRQLKSMVKLRTNDLKMSKERYMGLIESAPIGIMITNINGSILDANPAAIKMLGYSSHADFNLHTTSKAHLQNLQLAILNLHNNKRSEHTSAEIKLNIKNGDTIWVKITSHIQKSTSNEKNILTVIEDITDRKSNEIELENYRRHLEDLVSNRTADLSKSEKRFRTLTANSPGAVYRCFFGKTYKFEFISEAVSKLTGFDTEEIILSNIHTYKSIIHEDDFPIVESVISNAIKNKSQYELTYRIVQKNGGITWVEDRGSVNIENSDGETLLEGIIMDISEKKKSEACLIESMNELERFNRLTIGREKKILSLKKEVNKLLKSQGYDIKYQSVENVNNAHSDRPSH